LIVITDGVEKGQWVTALALELQLVLVMLFTTGALNDKPMVVVWLATDTCTVILTLVPNATGELSTSIV
jgi:hypothetical protein